MTALDLLLIILGVLAVIPCSYLYFKDKGNAYKVLMILSIIAGPIWAVSIVLFRNALSPDLVLAYGKIIYVNSILLGLSFFLFEQYFPRKKIHKSFFTILILGIAAFLIYSILFTQWFIESPILMGSNSLKLGNIYLLWMVWMLGIFSFGLINILLDYKTLGKIERHQLKYFIIGIIIPVIGVVPTNAIFPLLGNFNFIWVGPLAMCVMSLLLTLGIATKASNNKYATQVSMVRVFGILLYILEIFLLTNILIKNFQQINLIGDKLIWVFIFILVTAGSYFVGQLIVEKTIKYIFRDKIPDYTLLRDKYLDITAEVLDVKNLIKLTIQEILKSISVHWCGIVIKNSDDRSIYYNFSENKENLDIEDRYNILIGDLAEVLREFNNVCNRDSLEYILNNDYEKYSPKLLKRMEYVSNYLQSIGASEAMIIRGSNEHYGLFFIGYKKSTSASLNRRERELILSLLRSLSLGLSRANLHREVELANSSLQQKVNEQTKELQIKVLELQEARRKEADMIDIMGHELRTPATVVKLNIGLLQKYIDSNPADFKKYIERISNAVETEIGLINTLLTSAKLEGDKVEIKHEKVNIQEEIEMSMHGHEKEIKEGISFTRNIQPNLPYAYADRIRVAEVLNNLVSNAIKYTDKGSITISATSGDNNVIVSVKDTGKGISQEDLTKLGEKFYRVDNYLESDIVRPGGTGLGLYITFGLVRLMGGKIDVKSKVGEGSTFTFTLPKYNGQRVDSADAVDRFQKLGLKR